MLGNEAQSRILINQLLTNAGWRFNNGRDKELYFPANVIPEWDIKSPDGEKMYRADYALFDPHNYPICIVEAKGPDKNPLAAKEQARKYAKLVNAQFVILSNGLSHYLWNLNDGSPAPISDYPTQDQLIRIRNQGHEQSHGYKTAVYIPVEHDFIALTKMPNYAADPDYINPDTRQDFITRNGLKFLRRYQLEAVRAVQASLIQGNKRFLLEMATGTGKTLVAAAIIKYFFRAKKCNRVLFLVDRIELEQQAEKGFTNYLGTDYKVSIYKADRSGWRHSNIVITTIQSLLVDKRYKQFRKSDFDFVISDEAHRTIGGNSREVFEHFDGYKLGLTATPKDYLKNIPEDLNEKDPRQYEKRVMRDTYTTFGCEDREPTYRYSLLDGVRDGVLINPFVYDIRTDITTKILSEEGYAVSFKMADDQTAEETYMKGDFEKKFFSEPTNLSFCRTFLEKGKTDPVTGEFGKSIVFCVSQNHAAKITQLLNRLAEEYFPGRYNSDFAVQVTSNVPDSQAFTRSFTNNTLNGKSSLLPGYETSKTRVCVTVAMMTTGYDCPDLLNLALMRPVFSPTEFIQIKGRGTRTHTFIFRTRDVYNNKLTKEYNKETFLLFDYFGNYRYFEEEFQYDAVLELPQEARKPVTPPEPPPPPDGYENKRPDPVKGVSPYEIGLNGMRVDREFFGKFEDRVKKDAVINRMLREGKLTDIADYVKNEILGKADEHFTLENLRKALDQGHKELIDILMDIFRPLIKEREDSYALTSAINEFVERHHPRNEDLPFIEQFIRFYATDTRFREIIKTRHFAELNTYGLFSLEKFKHLGEYRERLIAFVDETTHLKKFYS